MPGSELRGAATTNLVRGNTIGFDLDDQPIFPKTETGIQIIDGASNNTIGGDTVADGNTVTAEDAAVEMTRGSNDNIVTRNILVLSKVGVLILNSSRNRIGGENISEIDAEGNSFDANKTGVLIEEEVAARKWLPGRSVPPTTEHVNTAAGARNSQNKVFGNVFAVLDPEDAWKDSTGIIVNFADDTFVGNGTDRFANLVGDCSYVGILVLNLADRTRIEANRVGVFSTSQFRPNAVGVRLTGSGSEVRNNMISKNTDFGLVINRLDDEDPVPTGNTVHSNWIGSNTSGDTPLPNDVGVVVDGRLNTITNNVISGNTTTGLQIQDDQNTIENNRIGTNAVGDAANGNGDGGMLVLSSQNTITNNTVSANEFGIAIARDPERPTTLANNNILRGNTVGTNRAGTAGLAGQIAGIIIADGAANNVIGGTSAGAGNVISGNSQTGIFLQLGQSSGAMPPSGNKIQGNYIGTNAAGTAGIQNGLEGIRIDSSSQTLVGGFGNDMPAARNIISANGRNGIALNDGSTQNRISGNYIGTKADGETALGNTERGIRVGSSTSGTIIGGPEANAGNTIAFNGSNGISLTSDAGNNNIIDPNRIFGNVLAGIDIGENGFTPNDPADADVGPNKLQNYPTMTPSIVGGDLIVSYWVDSAPQHSTYGGTGIYVEFFEADSTGAGRDFLGSDHYLLSDYTNGTPGTRVKNLGNAAALGIVAGDLLTATATDAEGNSSEFAPTVIAPGGAPGFEADVAPRPNGDGNMLSTDITQMRRFVSGLDTPNPATNEAQRIDCAPRSTFGDGIVNSSDVVQGRRYVSGLDVMTPAGGPASRVGSVPESIFVPNRDSGGDLFQRELSIGEPEFRRSTVIVPIELTSQGNEVAMSFTVEYDPSVLANPRITLGRFAPAGSTLTVNTNEPGRIGILIDSANAMTASAVPLNIATVFFEVKGEASGEAPIYLTGSLAATGISDALGNSLPTKYLGGVVRMNEKSALINRFFSLLTTENVFSFGA
ncbi:MAG: right-handed parallel beta-helix repeat-containing protein [Acidobacteria bacterium]|nr:right-handed parallel beta-helix repeat-containing protein [Acidobacteriota bacterium]